MGTHVLAYEQQFIVTDLHFRNHVLEVCVREVQVQGTIRPASFRISEPVIHLPATGTEENCNWKKKLSNAEAPIDLQADEQKSAIHVTASA